MPFIAAWTPVPETVVSHSDQWYSGSKMMLVNPGIVYASLTREMGTFP